MSHITLIKVDRGSTREMGLSAWPGGYKYTMGHPFFVPQTIAFSFALSALCASLLQPNLYLQPALGFTHVALFICPLSVYSFKISHSFSAQLCTPLSYPSSLSPICPFSYCDLAFCTHMVVFACVTYFMHHT